jgi:hypothetical protein
MVTEFRRTEAVPEALYPVRAGRGDADGDELVDREGQHHVQLDPEREGDLRDDDVGAAGERAVREADTVALQLFAHLGGHAGLLLVREARARARRRRHVAAEMDDLGLRQYPGDGFRIQAERRAEKTELAAGGGLARRGRRGPGRRRWSGRRGLRPGRRG